MISDVHSLSLLESPRSVDAINQEFYGKFQYPQAPVAFYAPADPDFETVMLNQSMGSWDHSAVPARPKIWVAGCGTNQAVYTALRFPNASIVASDLSGPSLATSAATADQLGVTNVEFVQGSINGAAFRDEFDYVICTGVIHHNADPLVPLSKLAAALKPTGVLELMVYNRYHRIAHVAFQKAMRILAAGADFDCELRLARRISDELKGDNLVTKLAQWFKVKSEAEFADALLQPIEYTFTVESLDEAARSCGLELAAPCINQFDKAQGTFSWNMEFEDAEVAALYDSLSDVERWKVSNHLMVEASPMLWFYLRRGASGRGATSERELCRQFLERSFVRSGTKKKHYLKAHTGRYVLSSRVLDYPGPHPDPLCGRVVAEAAARAGEPMRSVLRRLGVEETFAAVNKLRSCLTTNAFPFLVCAG